MHIQNGQESLFLLPLNITHMLALCTNNGRRTGLSAEEDFRFHSPILVTRGGEKNLELLLCCYKAECEVTELPCLSCSPAQQLSQTWNML